MSGELISYGCSTLTLLYNFSTINLQYYNYIQFDSFNVNLKVFQIQNLL